MRKRKLPNGEDQEKLSDVHFSQLLRFVECKITKRSLTSMEYRDNGFGMSSSRRCLLVS